MNQVAGAALGALCLGLAACAQTAGQAAADPAMTTLADRIAIEDMLTRYYEHFGGGANAGFGDYYTDDGVFEVNGQRYAGKQAIVGVYDSLGAETTPTAEAPVFHMIMSNPVIDIDGDSATAKLLWTGIDNPADATKPPSVREQGREYDKLVKVDGRWLIRHRVVLADSGLPASMVAAYQRQSDFAFPPGGN